MALNAHSVGLLNKNAHCPLLLKTSNLPSTCTVPNMIHPRQHANEGTIAPFAIHKRHLGGMMCPKRFLIFKKTVESIIKEPSYMNYFAIWAIKQDLVNERFLGY